MAHFLPTKPSYKLSHMHIIINDDGDGLLYKPNKHSNVHNIDLIILYNIWRIYDDTDTPKVADVPSST